VCLIHELEHLEPLVQHAEDLRRSYAARSHSASVAACRSSKRSRPASASTSIRCQPHRGSWDRSPATTIR
jgi:hypothetical protein